MSLGKDVRLKPDALTCVSGANLLITNSHFARPFFARLFFAQTVEAPRRRGMNPSRNQPATLIRFFGLGFTLIIAQISGRGGARQPLLGGIMARAYYSLRVMDPRRPGSDNS